MNNRSIHTGNNSRKPSIRTIFTAVVAAAALALAGFVLSDVSDKKLTQREKLHLEIFDDLDFNVFTNQKWGELGRSHAKDIIVHLMAIMMAVHP